MRWCILLIGIVAFSLCSCSNSKKTELEGMWTAVSAAKDSATKKGPPTSRMDKAQLTVAENQFNMTLEGRNLITGVFTLRPNQDPKEIDIVHPQKVTVGIYKLEGDELTLCFTRGGKMRRPTDFSTPAGSETMLFVLKRQSP